MLRRGYQEIEMEVDKTVMIPYTRPSITDLEVRYATDAATNGWGERCYEYIDRFEREFSKYLGVKYCIATSSCTGALHMGMHALGIGNGDEVILANTNWIATAAPIIHLGATPVFVDIEEDSWCIDPVKVEKAITPLTKAIVAVHLYGNICDLNKLLEIGERYNIPVIEDAAEAIGSSYLGRKAGSLGVFGAFSFHGTKTITTGEGGMFVTDDEGLYKRVLILSNHGRSSREKRQFWPVEVGYKYKMSNIEAAIGCAQLQRINQLIEEKRKIFLTYRERLCGLPLKMNQEPEGCQNGYWMPTVVVDDSVEFSRDLLIEMLAKVGVDARVFFWPLSQMNIGGRKADQSSLISERICVRGLNLPSYFGMSESDIDLVCKVLESHLVKGFRE